MPKEYIRIKGARQNNLKGLDLELPLGELIVVTGVSGSGKSSLAFDTIYAEGQRRYVETFSPYARQFLDRMDRPQVEQIEGIPPAIAIDQTNPVRTSRSTVGTMTELNDHIKLLFARAAVLYCRGCGRRVTRDDPEGIFKQLRQLSRAAEPRLIITFPVPVPEGFTVKEIKDLLSRQGYIRIHGETDAALEVVQDRVRLSQDNRARVIEALQTALARGHGHLSVHMLESTGRATKRHAEDPGGSGSSGRNEQRSTSPLRFSADLHCPDCDIHYGEPAPNLFSFNSPLGACETCRGFGRVIGIDYDLVVPDTGKSLVGGAVKPFQSDSYAECQEDLMRFAHARGLPTDLPWDEMDAQHRDWVLEGEGRMRDGRDIPLRGGIKLSDGKSCDKQ